MRSVHALFLRYRVYRLGRHHLLTNVPVYSLVSQKQGYMTIKYSRNYRTLFMKHWTQIKYVSELDLDIKG